MFLRMYVGLYVYVSLTDINKKCTLATNFHKPEGVSNPYVWFGYGPLKICNQTRGQVSVSMNANPINIIHTSKKSTKEGLNEELEGCFRSIKAIN